MAIIVMALGAVLFLYIIKNIYTKYWEKGVEASLSLSSHTAYPGDRLTLTEVIVNGKWLPLPMIKVKFAVDKSLVFDDVVGNTKLSDKCYKSDVFSILFYQKITRKLMFTCTSRGYFTIDTMDVVSTDVLMDSVLAKICEVNESLLVYPAPILGDEIEIPYKRLMGTVLSKQFSYEDPFEFKGIREYQQYDSMKDINWNASARTGELKVNVHNYTASRQVMLLLNLEDEGVLKDDDLKEKSISMASSLAYMLIEQGVMVSLFTNGKDKITQIEQGISSGCDKSHFESINTSLARIDLKQETCDFTQYLEALSEDKDKFGDGTAVVLISHARREELVSLYKKLKGDRQDMMWIAPKKEGWDIL